MINDLKRLTLRQAIFVSEYMKDGNGARAAIAAGYSLKNAKHRASKLLHNHEGVRAAVEKTRHDFAAKTQYNFETAMLEAELAMSFALQTKNANAYVKAVELRAKLQGLLVDRHDVAATTGFQVNIAGIRRNGAKLES